jgi:hypothetical protein
MCVYVCDGYYFNVCGNVLMALKVLTMAWRNDGNGSNVVNN